VARWPWTEPRRAMGRQFDGRHYIPRDRRYHLPRTDEALPDHVARNREHWDATASSCVAPGERVASPAPTGDHRRPARHRHASRSAGPALSCASRETDHDLGLPALLTPLSSSPARDQTRRSQATTGGHPSVPERRRRGTGCGRTETLQEAEIRDKGHPTSRRAAQPVKQAELGGNVEVDKGVGARVRGSPGHVWMVVMGWRGCR